ncbi:MAG: malto-oligosyltrehalose trehalohydrolase [Pirellulales bacterium]
MTEHFQTPRHPDYPPTLGATYLGDGKCRFLVWAPRQERVEVQIVAPDERAEERTVPMKARPRGYHEAVLSGVEPGARYFYRFADGRLRPDPASRLQSDGVHRASTVVDPRFDWTDGAWRGIPLHEYITYELHVGTFTPAGTFEAIIEQLDDLKELGVTAIELMPVAQFPGGRNWGYDGVHPFAVQNTYGGPTGLRRLVDAVHGRGLAVIMDVVYNHIGPEGNYLGEFGHYFTSRHRTPWGEAINFDDRDSDEVRRYFIENALYWIEEFHVDALRLDAVHAILDFSARPFLQELADTVRLEGERLGRRVYTIAESSLNDVRLIQPKEMGGDGIDGQWSDDLHHALRTTLTGDRAGYFADFHGFDDLVKAYRVGFVLDGEYSEFRGRRHGNSARDIEPLKLVVCAQNHDQVGNRMLGERLTDVISFEQLKLAAATVILSPYQPMLFMGEEYAETAPFQYFISHSDENLIEAVRRGRKEEFESFRWAGAPPDPQDEATFVRCKLDHALKDGGQHRVLREFYKALISLRKTAAALTFPRRDRIEVAAHEAEQVMIARRWTRDHEACTVFHFGAKAATLSAHFPAGIWTKALDSADPCWADSCWADPRRQGPGATLGERLESPGALELRLAPHSAAVYIKSA